MSLMHHSRNIAVLIGVTIGLLSGLFGVGGSSVSTPLLRILLTPYIVVELAHGNYLVAGWTFGGAAFTDILDGFLARRLGDQSKIGQYFDPIADKLLLTSIYVGLALGKAVPLWIVLLIFARDLWILALSGIALHFTEFRELQPSVWGKASTFLQILCALFIMIGNAFPDTFAARWSAVLIWPVALLTGFSGVHYVWRGLRSPDCHRRVSRRFE